VASGWRQNRGMTSSAAPLTAPVSAEDPARGLETLAQGELEGERKGLAA
jgi:hypothetical protein